MTSLALAQVDLAETARCKRLFAHTHTHIFRPPHLI